MKFDLSVLDYEKDLTIQLKEQFHYQVARMVKGNRRENKSLRKISLFHGTIFKYLNSILLDGMVPRDISNLGGNFHDDVKSNPNLVYLTDKWHYMYAQNAMTKDAELVGGDDMPIDSFPCYVEVEVREQDLIIDEDFFHSQYVMKKITRCLEKREYELKLTALECLDNYGTVAHIGSIDHCNVVSFTIMANVKAFTENMMAPTSKYVAELNQWGAGKGKGSLSLLELSELEVKGDEIESNLTFWMKDVRRHYQDVALIASFEEKKPDEPGVGNYRIRFNHVDKQH